MPETIVDLEPEFDVEPIEFEMPTDTIGGAAGGAVEPEPVEEEVAEGSGQEDILLRQTYEAVLEGSVPIEEYIRMGGALLMN